MAYVSLCTRLACAQSGLIAVISIYMQCEWVQVRKTGALLLNRLRDRYLGKHLSGLTLMGGIVAPEEVRTMTILEDLGH